MKVADNLKTIELGLARANASSERSFWERAVLQAIEGQPSTGYAVPNAVQTADLLLAAWKLRWGRPTTEPDGARSIPGDDQKHAALQTGVRVANTKDNQRG